MTGARTLRFCMSVIAAVLFMASAARGEPPSSADLRRAAEDNLDRAVSLYREFLALPNDALNPDDIEALVSWLERAFGERGFRTQRIPTNGNPALFAERRHDPAGKTVLVYLQADGQPVDPSAWAQANPFVPVLKERDENGDTYPGRRWTSGSIPTGVSSPAPRRIPRGR